MSVISCPVFKNSKFTYRFSSMISYGYFGDLMSRSERYRWLGPKRYDISGVRTFLGNRGYIGNISYKEAVDETSSATIHEKCKSDCQKCQEKSEENNRQTDNEKLVKSKELAGKFTVVTGACTKCASRFTPKGLSPGAHLGDGLVDLILVSKTSRMNYFRYLFRSAYLTSDPFDLPFVERIKVQEFTFMPPEGHKKKTSVWNCDGEILDSPKIHVKVHCQLLPVFARGPD